MRNGLVYLTTLTFALYGNVQNHKWSLGKS